MKKLFILFFLLLMIPPCTASSQDKSENNQETIDEVIALGTKQTDPAMSAFRSGDYATAEIEFKRNAFCALRATRNFRSGIEAAQDSTIRADVGTDFDSSPGSSGGLGNTPGPVATPPVPTVNLNSSDFVKNDSNEKRTCEDRGFQIYMMGMSQLKLGKREEAKLAFSRAVKMRKTLFDAHFRLGLLEYQDGNVKAANSHFEKIKKIEARCKNRCDARDEIKSQIEFMQKLFG